MDKVVYNNSSSGCRNVTRWKKGMGVVVIDGFASEWEGQVVEWCNNVLLVYLLRWVAMGKKRKRNIHRIRRSAFPLWGIVRWVVVEKKRKEKGWTIVVDEDKPNRITCVVQEQILVRVRTISQARLATFLGRWRFLSLTPLGEILDSPMLSDLCLVYYLLPAYHYNTPFY